MRKWLVFLLITAVALLSFSLDEKTADERIRTRADLGRKLFNEKMLSLDSSVSCASCHKPEFAFADTLPFSIGIGGKKTKRNTPSVLNMKNRPYFFWDGRATTLEQQALMPIQNPDEMGLPLKDALKRLNGSAEYRALFRKIFRQDANEKNLALAFSSFEKTLETTDSKFDAWSNGEGALSDAEERGRQLFIDKAHCFDCHFREDFTDDEFRNIGLFNGKNLSDAGRQLISGDSADAGKFKTAGLRNVGVTAPYMHNGMFQTLEEVVDYYDDPSRVVNGPVNVDPDLRFPLRLTAEEKKDLVSFLGTLTDKGFLVRPAAH